MSSKPEPISGDSFARATRRLVLLFGGIVVILVLASTVLVYATVTADLHNVLDKQVLNEDRERAMYTQAMVRLRYQVLAIDGAIFLVIGLTGLWYARRTMKPIRDALDNQRRFIADASHELRTPLAIMKADFELARTGEQDPGELRTAVDHGAEEVDRMSAIVADLLMLSRIDAREEHLELERTDLDALLGGTVKKLGGLAAVQEVRLAYQADAEALMVLADSARLQRALLNLCRNAIEHSPRGGEVTLALRRDRDKARIDVTDKGDGMTREQLEHAFDRFYRADHSRQSSAGNSGLGLPIAKWIVEAHRGSLTLASRPGQGTAATIRLPL
jgi:two-component system sensor histidine kinase CiaH